MLARCARIQNAALPLRGGRILLPAIAFNAMSKYTSGDISRVACPLSLLRRTVSYYRLHQHESLGCIRDGHSIIDGWGLHTMYYIVVGVSLKCLYIYEHISYLHLPGLPTNPANPPSHLLHIIPAQNAIKRVPMPSKLLITRHPMHKIVASPAQPGHAIQHPLIMPPPLEHLGMHFLGDEMVIRQRDPISAANLARVGTG